MNGFSSLPPPAISPTVALHFSSTSMLFPDGSLRIALPFPLEKRTAEPPAALTSFPPSPALSSMFEILRAFRDFLKREDVPVRGRRLGPERDLVPDRRDRSPRGCRRSFPVAVLELGEGRASVPSRRGSP